MRAGRSWMRGPSRGVAMLVLLVVVAMPIGGATSAGAAPMTEGMLRVTTSPSVPSQITLDGHVANTWGLDWVKVAPGSHTVCFGAVAGYVEPGCQTVNVTAGVTTQVSGSFTAQGFLQVSTSPPVGSQISVDGVPRNNWGLFTQIAPGSHQVCFGAVAGVQVPPCQSVNVTAGQTASVTGSFTPNGSASGLAGVGMLRVTTTPAVASTVSVDGQARDAWGLNWLEIAPGPHQVCFGAVAGVQVPPCQSVNVTAGQTTSVNGTFTQKGTLRVTTTPPAASTIAIDGNPANDWGVWTEMPAGAYQICFGPAVGFTPPPCKTATVAAGQTTEVTSEAPAATCPSPPGTSSISETECAALVALYQSAGGTGWVPRTKWMTAADPCTWWGITCANGFVSKIDLWMNDLEGVIPPEIGNLTHVTDVHFGNNDLTSVPDSIGNMTGLVNLDLSGNELTSLPATLGNLPNLVYLDVGYNKFTGDISSWAAPLAAANKLTNLLIGDTTGYNNCLTVSAPGVGTWLTGLDPTWNQCS